MSPSRPVLALLAACALAGCTRGGAPVSAPSASASASELASASASPSASAAATASARPSAAVGSPSATPARSGARSASCVNGWTTPATGTPNRQKPLDLLRQTQGFTGTFRVDDLRFFTGPDDANLSPESKQKTPVKRWYGKVVYSGDPSFKLRFLVVQRNVGEGVVAIAPYDRAGFRTGGWLGFDGEGGSNPYPGVPGRWPGQPYDYDAAGELPAEVAGCVG